MAKCKHCGCELPFGVLTCPACNAPVPQDDINDYVIDGTVLKKYVGSSSNIIIPAGIKTIAERAFERNLNICTVDMSQSQIERIGAHAFQNCTNITLVKSAPNLSAIGDNAFRNCASLTRIYVPQCINTIGAGAFADCRQLFEIQIGTDAKEKRKKGGDVENGEYVYGGGVPLVVGEIAFGNCSSLININLTARLQMLASRAFDGCDNLKTVTLRVDEDTAIADDAFSGCNKISKVIYSGDKMSGDWWEDKFDGNKVKIKYVK